jgi:SAM-dependent methyltransferase
MNRREHWDAIYTTRREQDLSWFETAPVVSMRLIQAAGLSTETCVIDIGGGDSRLVDQLLAKGVTCLAVLDVSGVVLRRAQARLGAAAEATALTWIESDVVGEWSLKPVDIWHDRAVFHFLTAPEDRARYLEHLRGTLKPGGTAIIATFALDGPKKCSGLPVVHYSASTLAAELGSDFTLVETIPYLHRTPSGVPQSFQYSRFQRSRVAAGHAHIP